MYKRILRILVLSVAVSACGDTTQITNVYLPPPGDTTTTPSDTTTTTVTVTGVTITPATVVMKMCVGLPAPTQQLSAKVEPVTVDQSVKWSLNSTVASVNSTGLVTAKGLGQTMATAQSVADSTVAGNATIIVNGDGCGVAPADSTIQIVPDTITIAMGQTAQPTAICRISGVVTNACKPWFRSTDHSVAVVNDSSGVITTLKPGTTLIIVQWAKITQVPVDTALVVVTSG